MPDARCAKAANITALGATESMIDGLVESTIVLPGGYHAPSREEIAGIFKASL